MKNFVSISIEGGDSTGKATQTALLKDALRQRGLKVLSVEVPVKSLVTHTLIYFMLRRKLAIKNPRFFHFLQFINKFWWQVFTLPFLMNKYDVVLFDRWHGSYWVYGLETGLSTDDWLMRLYHSLFKPDATIVLYGHRNALETRDEYESNSDLQERVRRRYVEWAKSNPLAEVVSANQDILAVHHDVIEVLSDRGVLPEKRNVQ